MNTVDLPNIGIVIGHLDSDLIKIIGSEVDKIQSDFSKATATNSTLVGNILQEYELHDCREAIELQALKMAQLHQQTYGANYGTSMQAHTVDRKKTTTSLKLGGLWVNFQKKNEFNPIHNHTGMYSFVIWHKVPYYANIENIASPGRKAIGNRSGKFEFSFTNILGNITGSVIDVDKTYEGHMCLFPALLNHSVYPFYSSDDYRISISGNLFVVSES